MKSILNFFIGLSFLTFIQNNSKAQDLIHLKTGEIIKCKILLNETYVVKYKKWEFLDGPRYVKLKSEIKNITLEKPAPITTTIQPESKPILENSNNKPTTPVIAPNPNPIDEQKAYITSKMKDIKNYMLVIANQDYIDNSINDLDHPISDAKKIISILSEKYTFDQPNITFLQNPDRAEIIRSFDKLAQKITPNDNLLIFYAGHGIWDNQLKKGYWLPKNARQNDRSDWFSNSDLRDYIGGINSKHTLLIADACFSGSIFKTREAFSHSTEANVALELFKTPSRQAMTSGAMKSVPDKSVFIEYLCKRLSENQETFLGTEQLFGSFKIAVMNNSANVQIPQFGVIKESGDEGGDFVFIKR